MGKKGTKRRTRWKTLPLATEDGASGNEDELQDDERSTTSSGRIIVRMGERPYRQNRRFPFERDRSREPLIKLESKTFDEEEYTKITTPRQDLLLKKGRFGRRKVQSSIEESMHINGEMESEEGNMEQIIITNGFVDERGHYLVNGSSYEIYDPYTNTVTVMVGPPPYTSGVTPPVLAAVSCQPVPLQPVDWYPTGPGDWPPGPAWAPAYPPPKGPDTGSSEGDSPGSEEAPPFQPPFLFPGLVYPVPFRPNGMPENEMIPGAPPDSTEGELPPCREPLPPQFTPTEVHLNPETTPPSPSDQNVTTPSPLSPTGPEFIPKAEAKPHVPSHPLKPNGVVFVPRNIPPPYPMQFRPPEPNLPDPEPRHKEPSVPHMEAKEEQRTHDPTISDTKAVSTPSSDKEESSEVRQKCQVDTLTAIDSKSPTTHQPTTTRAQSQNLEPSHKPELCSGNVTEESRIVQNSMKLAPNSSVNEVNASVIKTSPIATAPRETQSTQTANEESRPQQPPSKGTAERHSPRKAPAKAPILVNPKQSSIIEQNSRRSYAKTVLNGLDQFPGLPNGYDSTIKVLNAKTSEDCLVANGKAMHKENGAERKENSPLHNESPMKERNSPRLNDEVRDSTIKGRNSPRISDSPEIRDIQKGRNSPRNIEMANGTDLQVKEKISPRISDSPEVRDLSAKGRNSPRTNEILNGNDSLNGERKVLRVSESPNALQNKGRNSPRVNERHNGTKESNTSRANSADSRDSPIKGRNSNRINNGRDSQVQGNSPRITDLIDGRETATTNGQWDKKPAKDLNVMNRSNKSNAQNNGRFANGQKEEKFTKSQTNGGSINGVHIKNKESAKTEINPASNGLDSNEESDGTFIPVENRRSNKISHNGFSSKNKYNAKLHNNDALQVNKESLNTKKEITELVNTKLSQVDSSNKTANLTKESAEVDKTYPESDKSSTISELSSPTELSSGQTTPPDKSTVSKLEAKSSSDLNKSVEKLKENLVEETKAKKPPRKPKKKQQPKVETPKVEEEEVFEEPPPLPAFLQPPTDELAHLDKFLDGAAGDAILRSLRVSEPVLSKINLFTPRPKCFPYDLYTKTNLSNMRSTRPEELFASVVDHPTNESPKVSEKSKKSDKSVARAADRVEAVRESQVMVRKPISTAYKPSRRKESKKEDTPEETQPEETCPVATTSPSPEAKLGIVEAVKTWLESQEVEPEEESDPEPKNGICNPLHVSSVDAEDAGGCKRVAGPPKETQKSDDSSVDQTDHIGTTPQVASLVDARTSVDKYYNLTPNRGSRQSEGSEASEPEAIDALEYSFPRASAATTNEEFPTKDLACKLQ